MWKVLLGLVLVTGLLTSGALGAIENRIIAGADTANCGAAHGTTVFTLTDVVPDVRLSLALGSEVVVRTPKWPQRATVIKNSNRAVLHQVCSFLTTDSGRESVYVAKHLGRSLLWATVTPAGNTFMPSWSGIVKVTAASSAQ